MTSTTDFSITSSIQTKVILTTVLVVTVMLMVFASYNYLTERNDKYNALKTSAQVSAERLSATLVIPLWDLDKDLIDKTLESEMLNRDIVALILRDSDGRKIFSAKQRNYEWEVVDVDATQGVVEGVSRQTRFQDVRQIFFSEEEMIGQIEVHVSERFVDEALRGSLIATIVTMLVLDIIVFAVLFLLLRFVIIQPILNLSASVERMSRGELDIELDFNRRDEIGLVANAIERMQVSLRIAMGRLSRSNANEQ